MIRIVIAEDQELLLGTIGSLLNLENDMEVVGQAQNGEEVLTLVNRFRPDICIMDIEMLEEDGFTEALKKLGCKLIVLTTFARTGYLQRVEQSDVRGYLLKDSPSEEFTSSIRSIMDGMRIYSPKLMENDPSNIEEVELNDISIQQRNPSRTVKSYFSTIIDKMKKPAG